MSQVESASARRLREQAERALAAGQGRKVLEPLFERLVAAAEPGSEGAVFAHRGLAELRVQEHPWRALLHLKHVLAAQPRDDVAHAMAGLAHAISGHYRSSVASYRKATQCAPENPWYQHNLGHLLDVALEQPARALSHLRAAHETLGDEEPEVAASLASCLARRGPRERAEAQLVVTRARGVHPRHEGLSQLARALGPISASPGAHANGPVDSTASRRGRTNAKARHIAPVLPLRPRAATVLQAASADEPARSRTRSSRPPESEPAGAARATASGTDLPEAAVLATLRARLGEQSKSFREACRVWREYAVSAAGPRRGRMPSADVLAAAVDYVVARHEARPITLASIAREYGVTPRAVALRSEEIERALGASGP